MSKKEKKTKIPKDKSKATCRTSIGGQAVLEGVMMKGSRSIATAVRSASGEITVESKYTKPLKERNWILRLPFIRGVVNLITQLFQGTGIMMRSAEVYGDFAEPSKFDKWVSDKLKINPMSIVMTFSVILGIALAVGLFVFLPNFLAGLICDHISAIDTSSLRSLWYSLIEGGIMLVIFISYILLVSVMKDIRRVFMYHGAEHKTIACYEHGLELTVENAKTMRREHSRCGTTFIFFVIAVSIMVFVLINFMLEKCGLLVTADMTSAYKVANVFIRLGFKLLFLPVVAGVSYELLKLLAKSDCLFVRILRFPGMMLQKLTTREPEDDMLEVAIVAFKTVLEMEQNDNVPERQFSINVPYGVARKRFETFAPKADESDIDWLFVEVTGCKRSEVAELKTLTKEQFDAGEIIAKKMATGLPFQYAVGNTDFYGVKISVNQNVLIPRPETEELVEKTIAEIGKRDAVSLLDLCTGSGAIATVIAKKTGCRVTASDISGAALDVARANALNAGVKGDFVQSDMFEKIEGKFDVIVSNPPYIPTKDIDALDERVKNFEPRLALDGDKDGLKFYRIIAENLDKYLAYNGVFLCEFGINQAEDIKEIFKAYKVEILKDIEGKDRIAVVRV
ncbi:MAG: peptide chain release factor N(5)-glutamine methyltransferase [Clostridia bacterium]|nr:peptide chain release factor N(5)-glutamine methyltransferase [Clostridia bacterium]